MFTFTISCLLGSTQLIMWEIFVGRLFVPNNCPCVVMIICVCACLCLQVRGEHVCISSCVTDKLPKSHVVHRMHRDTVRPMLPLILSTATRSFFFFSANVVLTWCIRLNITETEDELTG